MGAMAGGSLLSQIVGCKPPAMPRPKEVQVQAGWRLCGLHADHSGQARGIGSESDCLHHLLTTANSLLRFKEGQCGFQEVEIDFVADNPGLTLFPCHQQLHMDFGFMSLFEYV
jgi:hypothetical protein